MKPTGHTLPLLALILLLVAASMIEWEEPTETAEPQGVEPVFTRFRKVDDYPLYVLHYNGDYGFSEYLATGEAPPPPKETSTGRGAQCSRPPAETRH